MSKFTIPSLAEIKAANKISSKNEPSLFKASTRISSNQPQHTASSSGAPGIQPSASGGHGSAAKNDLSSVATMRKSENISKQGPSLDSDVTSKHHDRPFIPEVTSKGLTTASKEGTIDELDRRHAGHDQQNAASSSLPSSASASVAQASTYRPHAIVVNVVQKKNPLMKHIRNVPWEVGNIVPDFELGKTTCALFLSVRYHSLHPNYIHDRLKSLGKQYQLRVLLVLVDTSESQKVLHELARIALLTDLTLILSWSYEEAARYLETYKAYENKPPDLIMERIDSDSSSRAIECLTTVKKVNKTDAATLMNTFKTMEKLVTASKEELTLCPGLGPLKAQRLHDLFHEPFLKSAAKKPKVD